MKPANTIRAGAGLMRITLAALVSAAALFSASRLCANAPGAQQDSRAESAFAGFIKVNCNAQLVDKVSGATIALSKSNLERPVSEGDRLECTGPGEILLELADTDVKITQQDGPKIVVAGNMLQSLRKYSDPALTRGPGASLLYSPPRGGAALPEQLIVRWNTQPQLGSVRVTLRPENGSEELCCRGRFSGLAGMLDSAELRQALLNYRQAHREEEKFRLTMVDSANQSYETVFSLLSPAEAARLNAELQQWQGKDAILRHAGRAFTFDSYGLFDAAAQEYQAALAIAPASPFLLRRTIAAEKRTGNLCRAEELRSRAATEGSKTSAGTSGVSCRLPQ